MSDGARLANMLFPGALKTPEELLSEIYPPRALKEGAIVTRFAPSPTGFIHIGNVFAGMVAERAGHCSNGTVILRIEDTDKKREIEGGVSLIIESLRGFGINFDEGPFGPNGETGAYGPYIQSGRRELYHSFCRDLVLKGHAYPCFCTEQEISEIRSEQEKAGLTPGYWGVHARCRDLTLDEVERRLAEGRPYVMRLRSPGKPGGRVGFKDVIRGQIEMEENYSDIVLLKSDGLPTYHFAHVVDDTLMRVNQVIRGDEWIASAPVHLQLFWLCGLKAPKYAHVSPIMKEENGGKRKLSKRKDPEAAATFFAQQGYPSDAIMEYLLSIANSNFEDWQRQNKDARYTDFPFALGKMSASGALFDMDKLNNISAGVISRMSASEVCEQAAAWAREYDSGLHSLLTHDMVYSEAIFAIDRGVAKPRKDIARWTDVADYVSYFFDETFTPESNTLEFDAATQAQVLEAYLAVLDACDDKDAWFGKIKSICAPLGFCPDVKEYKANPGEYKGHVGDISGVIRVALTGRKNTPDLHAIMALLGQARCENRIKSYIESIK